MGLKVNTGLRCYCREPEDRRDSPELGGQFNQGESAMLVDMELREELSYYCMVTKQTQERAANQALKEMLQRIDSDPVMKERIDRARELKRLMAEL
jgi:hypothetical protein